MKNYVVGLVVPLLADPYFAEMARFLEQVTELDYRWYLHNA